MVSKNYISGIVRISEEPECLILDDNIYFTTCIAESEQLDSIHLNFWGDLAYYVFESYQTDDYILIEGYISLNENEMPIDTIESKEFILTVLETYLIY